MEYNKESFLAGIAVGRRIKGWSGGSGSGGGSGGKGNGIIIGPIVYRLPGKIFEQTPLIIGELIKEE